MSKKERRIVKSAFAEVECGGRAMSDVTIMPERGFLMVLTKLGRKMVAKEKDLSQTLS